MKQSTTDAVTPNRSTTTSGENLSQQVFKDPQDFLTELKTISKGNSLTLPELRDIAAHGQDAKGQAAAQIALGHFEDLAGIHNYDSWSSKQRMSTAISQSDLNFALDMSTHNIFGHAMGAAAEDATVGLISVATGAAAGAIGEALAADFAATGAWGGVALMGGLLGLPAIGTIAYGGYAGYEAFREYGNYSKLADTDYAKFSSWLGKK